MHTSIMKFVLTASTVIGVIVSIAAGIFAGFLVGEVADGGLGFLTFLLVAALVYMLFEAKIAMMGMQVEQAENIREMKKDMQMLLQVIQTSQNVAGKSPGSGMSVLEYTAAQRSVAPQSGSTGYRTIQPNTKSKWVCRKCLAENEADSQFCSVCGNEKSY